MKSSMPSMTPVAVGGRLLAALLLLGSPAAAEVQLGQLFRDGAVLQRGAPVPVWGTAAPGERVTVSLGDRSASAIAGADGRWRAVLEPLEAGGPFELHANEAVARDVLVGEVWICSGQSNMEWPLAWASKAQREIAAADHPRMRLFKVPRTIGEQPLSEIVAGRDIEDKPLAPGWAVCTPESAAMFSAVGYHFGRELGAALEVPIGLVQSAWGGTPAEAWTTASRFSTDPALEPSRMRTDLAGPGEPSVLFNGMIAPLVPCAFRGVIWYQGEANVKYAGQYAALFTALIESWREAWGREDMPFLLVQLAAFLPRQEQPVESPWAELREAQAQALALEHVGMACAIDIGAADDIHPRNKREVGRRLALIARANVYGEEGLVFSGPVFAAMSVEGADVRVRFDHAEGLAARGGEVRGFALAGADRKWRWAGAEIVGDEVVVRASGIDHPVAVRYAWADNPDCNLVNGAGLPAVPFQSGVGSGDRR
jgi:sialate O-acetylesterase